MFLYLKKPGDEAAKIMRFLEDKKHNKAIVNLLIVN